MGKKKSRLLNTFELAEHFVVKVLGLELTEENYGMIPKIVETELNIENFDDLHETRNSKAYRNYFVRQDVDRSKLRKKIVEELVTKKRLKSDDQIVLGKGGAAPRNELKQDSEAFIIIGLPASGKSTIANSISDSQGCFTLDSDYAKRKIPEFHDLQFGASLVHAESSDIIFGEEKKTGFKSVLEYISKYSVNCVIPKIGSTMDSILDLREILKVYGYECHLILVELDRVKSTTRALYRFLETNRYVPLGMIFDDYSNNPTITYYRLKSEHSSKFKSFGILSTDVKRKAKPVIVEVINNSPIKIFR